MARVKRAVNAHKKRRTTLERASRLPRPALAPLPQGQGAGHPLAGLQLQRPPQEQGQLPSPVDPADQRRRPRPGHDLQPLHPGPQASPVSRSTARSSPTWPSTTSPRSTRSSRPPRPACPRTSTRRRPPRPRPEHQPLAASNARVKEARRLSRRSVRTERRLFLADGPKAVEGALAVARLRGRGLRRPRPPPTQLRTPCAAADAGAAWTLVDDRALASLSESVTPAGVVAVCRFLDRPLAHVLPTAAPGRAAAPTSATPATPAP